MKMQADILQAIRLWLLSPVFLRDDHPAQLIDAADDSGCFHLCTILPILHFPMLCSYYVEAEGKYTPARPVFAKQGRL